MVDSELESVRQTSCAKTSTIESVHKRSKAESVRSWVDDTRVRMHAHQAHKPKTLPKVKDTERVSTRSRTRKSTHARENTHAKSENAKVTPVFTPDQNKATIRPEAPIFYPAQPPLVYYHSPYSASPMIVSPAPVSPDDINMRLLNAHLQVNA